MRALAPPLIVVVVVLAAACSDPPAAPTLARATPEYGPLVGGTRIVLTGTGFGDDARVLVGGREAPLAHAVDATTLDVVIPPGDQPGDAELVVLGALGTATAEHLFHYSAPPAIDAVAPADVVFSSTTTVVTVTGRGFLDEGAGEVSVLVDGQVATDVTVTSDTELTFVAPPGPPLVRPELQVLDLRGAARRSRSFRYRIGPRGGLLAFSRFGAAFATFYDPVDNSTIDIPRVGTSSAFTTVVLDEGGDYWGFDRSRRWGRIDMRTQTLEAPLQTGVLFPAMVRVGADYFALERYTLRFGTFDPVSGAFTPVGAATLPCCGSYGIASDGTTLWFIARQSPNLVIASIDPTTGALGTPVPLIAGTSLHLEELRAFGGVLYATNADGTLITIDPVTGATTVLPVAPGRANAMEIVE